MGINIKGRKVVEATSVNKFLDFGIELVKIVDITSYTSQKDGSRSAFTFTLEGPKIDDFEGYETKEGYKAEGLFGWIGYATWFNPETEEDKTDNFIDNMLLIAEKAGFIDAMYSLDDDISFDEFLDAFKVAAKDKYFWAVIAQDAYNGKKKLQFADTPVGQGKRLILVKHKDFYDKKNESKVVRSKSGKIVELPGTNKTGEKVGVETILKFDPEYHYKPIKEEKADKEADLGLGEESSEDDLPF